MEHPEGPEKPRRPGHPCPQCGARRQPDNTPSCGCGPRASDALREARTAQAAAAEDFDPLRIRPYVELEGAAEGGAASAQAPQNPQGPPEPRSPHGSASQAPHASASQAPHASASQAPHASASEAPPGAAAPRTRQTPGDAADATMPLRAVGAGAPDATSVLPTPLAPPPGSPSATDLSLFDTAPPDTAEPDARQKPAARPARRRRGVLLGVAGAVVAVLGAAGYASGLFSYETPTRDGASAKEVRAEVPEPSAEAPSSAPAPSTASASPTSASPSPSASASPSASPSPSPSPSASSASPTPSRSAEPTPTGTATRAGEPPKEPDDRQDRRGREDGTADGTVLRRGDSGPEVTELQHRLSQLYLYVDDIDGYFGREVEDALRNYQWARGIRSDDLGEYGPETRRRLEAETREP
ncbi:peptidoglycan-binding protein [Streptomyces sp. HMX87]|uniref:peptidoglycan-binding protein n=1 Tax=Streptomyces sp. HMX87 TaxID=3390849 RepID=UPI003A838BBA